MHTSQLLKKSNYYILIRSELLGADKSVINLAITTSQKHQKKSSLQTFINVVHIEKWILKKILTIRKEE